MDDEAKRFSRSMGLGKMLKDLGYSKVARLDTGLRFISDYEVESRIRELAKQNKLEVVRLQGGTAVVDRCYVQARQKLSKANQEEFSRNP